MNQILQIQFQTKALVIPLPGPIAEPKLQDVTTVKRIVHTYILL